LRNCEHDCLRNSVHADENIVEKNEPSAAGN
jgi:hypothetical protein